MNRSDEPLFDPRIAGWLEDDPHAAPDAALDIVLAAFPSIKQRRAARVPWRFPEMPSTLKLAAGIATIAVLGLAGMLFINRGPNVADGPTPSPSATPSASEAVVPVVTSSPEVTAQPEVGGPIAFSRVANASADILVAATDGTGMAPVILAPGNDVQPAWSPDGRRIAWASTNGIRIAEADGRGVVQLTDDGRDRDPAWSADGALIVFASNRDGDFEIYEQPVGGGKLRQLTDNDAEDTHPNWSAAADAIVFASDRAGTSDIWTMNANGENLGQLTVEGGADDAPAWSPDGTRIAFASDRDSATPFIYLMNADGSGVERLLAGGEGEHDPAWSPDGRYIALAKPQAGTGSAIYIVDVTTRRVVGTLGQERAEFNYPAWRNP